jgi:predicted ester cyclase
MTTSSSLVRRILEQALSQGNLAIVDDLVAVDAATHSAGWAMAASRLGLKQIIATLRAAFPDLHCTLDDEIEGESKSAALWTMRGSHQGSFLGNQATGLPVVVQGFIFIRTADGQIVENWILIDQIGLLQQLGIIPPPRGDRK